MTVKCPQISEVAIVADDAQLAAQLSCVLAAPNRYLGILEKPRMTRPDRDSEVIRCANALACSKAKHFIFAGLGDITSTALSVGVPTQKTTHVRGVGNLAKLQFPKRQLKNEALVWGKDRIGIGLLKGSYVAEMSKKFREMGHEVYVAASDP